VETVAGVFRHGHTTDIGDTASGDKNRPAQPPLAASKESWPRGPGFGAPLKGDNDTSHLAEPQNIEQGMTIEEGWNRCALLFISMVAYLTSTFCHACGVIRHSIFH
jgi:hypothetical protein